MMAGGESETGLDFDLNLAPIIDCFTVVITYLLVSASFISLTCFDVGVAANGEAEVKSEPTVPPMSLEIELLDIRTISLKLTGGAQKLNLSFAFPRLPAGGWDTKSLAEKTEELKQSWGDFEDVNISAEPGIKYKELIKVIETIKKIVPKIYVAG